ncbi:tail fiber assembly [Ralstonia phage RSJ2]|uniref:Putative tail fiber assembly potein homolog n=1 Tax=Ralstonia phage RSJ2 TaxID=1481785 RepID=A0A068Q7U2_9CAUD|nr:tail fiber assembly [Ralstonia phage RSJ2]BAP15844.1 putative tail fiber assembly potein homolog [Ralstonia phage RSJ2]
MFINQFDSISGAYLASTLAQPDPANETRWLVPAFSTDLPLPERARNTWPFFNGTAWELKPDFRGMMLYRQEDGTAAEILAPGIRPEDVGLTSQPRPSDEYHWVEGVWQVDPLVVAAKARASAMAEFDTRMETARRKNFGKNDALALGLLTPAEKGVYKAWSLYQMALTAVVNHPDFPTQCEWPDEPDEAVAAAAGEKEAADEAARIAAHEAQERAIREMVAPTEGA